MKGFWVIKIKTPGPAPREWHVPDFGDEHSATVFARLMVLACSHPLPTELQPEIQYFPWQGR